MILTLKSGISALDYLNPLDAMSASAFRALSVRKLRSAYSGYAFKLRRSSDNATTDVAFSSYDFVTGASSVSAGGDLSTWKGASNLFIDTLYDQSTNAQNGTQVISGAQIQFILDGGTGINNRPVMRFSGSQYLNIPHSYNGPSSLTFAIVLGNAPPRAVRNRFFNDYRTADDKTMFRLALGTDGKLQVLFTNFIVSVANAVLLQSLGSVVNTSHTQFLIAANFTTTVTATNYEKGAQLQTGTSGATWQYTLSNNGYQLGANSSFPEFYIGDLSEIIMFTSDISASDKAIVTQSQRGIFNLT